MAVTVRHTNTQEDSANIEHGPTGRAHFGVAEALLLPRPTRTELGSSSELPRSSPQRACHPVQQSTLPLSHQKASKKYQSKEHL